LGYSRGFKAAVILEVQPAAAAAAAADKPNEKDEEDQTNGPRSSPTSNRARITAAAFWSKY
jgi:hypothetical protein